MPPSVPVSPESEGPTPRLPTSTTRRKTVGITPKRKVSRRVRSSHTPSNRRKSGESSSYSDEAPENHELNASLDSATTPSTFDSSAGMMGGSSMMYGGGMYGSPFMYGGGMPMMGGPFSGVYQLLFGVQNVVFSVTQAIHLMGTNQQAIQHAFESLTKMMDHALATFQELRTLEATEHANESEEKRKRRQRLKTLRWAFVVGSSWLLYKVIRQITTSRRRKRLGYEGGMTGSSMMQYPYSSGGYGMGSQFGGYGGGGYYGGGGGYQF